jgi:PKD repeat protein
MKNTRLIPLAVLTAVLAAACDGTEPSNTAPTAAFTAQCYLLECTLTNGSGDVDGNIDSYAWNFGDNSAGATTRDAVHAYAAAGRFTVTLTVTDNGGATTRVSEQVEASANVAPTALFVYACPDLTCEFIDRSFDGNASGRVTRYAWDFGDGTFPATTKDAAHTYAAPGSFTVTLTVTDDAGATATVAQQVKVVANVPPTASFGFSCADLACQFTDHSTDGDPSGWITSYAWDFGDGQSNSTEASPRHVYATNGRYTVRLTVTDNRGASGSVSNEVFVPTDDGVTVAEFSVTCVSLECTFTDQSTNDQNIGFWVWDFGDGQSGSGRNPVHAYQVSEPTTFTVTLTLWDPYWWDTVVGSATHDITVAP